MKDEIIKKSNLKVGQEVIFIWSGKNKYGVIEVRKSRSKKFYYSVRCDDGKLYEDMQVDDSNVGSILTRESNIVIPIIKQRRSNPIVIPEQLIDAVIEEPEDEFLVMERDQELDLEDHGMIVESDDDHDEMPDIPDYDEEN